MTDEGKHRKRMRVGQVCAGLSYSAGGVFSVVECLAKALNVQADVSPVLFGTADEATPDWLYELAVEVHASDWKGPEFFRYSPQMLKNLESGGLDLLHVHTCWLYPSIAALQWKRFSGKSYIVTTHGVLDPWALKRASWKKAAARLLYEKRFLQQASCIHALCEPEVAAIRDCGLRNPICLIPNGVFIPDQGGKEEIPEWRKTLTPDTKILLYFGRLHRKKGLSELIRGWSHIEDYEDAEGWHLIIAGWGESDYEAALRQLTASSKRISFIGPQYGEAIGAMFKMADAFILPSISEGLPIVVLEAWAHGVPVLMTSQCNLPEGYQQGAALEVECNSSSLAASILEMMKMNDARRKELGRQGLALVKERFSWDVIADDMARVYLWLAGKGEKPRCIVD